MGSKYHEFAVGAKGRGQVKAVKNAVKEGRPVVRAGDVALSCAHLARESSRCTEGGGGGEAGVPRGVPGLDGPRGVDCGLSTDDHDGEQGGNVGDAEVKPTVFLCVAVYGVEGAFYVPAGGIEGGAGGSGVFDGVNELKEIGIRAATAAEPVLGFSEKAVAFPGCSDPLDGEAHPDWRARGRKPVSLTSASGSLGLGQSQPHFIQSGMRREAMKWNAEYDGGRPGSDYVVSEACGAWC